MTTGTSRRSCSEADEVHAGEESSLSGSRTLEVSSAHDRIRGGCAGKSHFAGPPGHT